MATLPASDTSIDLRAVTVRPTWGAQEHPALGPAGGRAPLPAVPRCRRQGAAPCRGAWRELARTARLAAGRVQAGRARPLGRLVGAAAVQALASRYAHLIANNSRFVILTPERVPNLASRVLGLSLRRLSHDIEAVHGYPALLAETFVDVLALRRHLLPRVELALAGLHARLRREPGARRGALAPSRASPRRVFVFELTDGARRGAEPGRDTGTLERRATHRADDARPGCAASSSVWARCPSAAMPGASAIP